MTHQVRMIALVLCCAAVAGCTEPRLDSSGSIGQDGTLRSTAGIDAGRVGASVSTDGRVQARADVIEDGPIDLDVGIGTGGPSAGVGLDGVPVRVGFGRSGWRIGW